MEKLTQDLIIDFLSRLPTLSLLQSTCVRKSWHHIITTDPIFTTLRNNRSSISTDALIFKSPKKLYLTQINDAPFAKKFDLSSVLHGISIQGFYLKVVGVCNGLICLASYPKVMIVSDSGTTHMVNSFYIINPISKENLQVPKYDESLNIGSTSKIKRMFYGFGFDKRNQVFKLAVFVFGFDDDNVKKLIITLGEEASGWRTVLGSLPCMMRYAMGSNSNLYLDGCLHWIIGTTMPNSTDRTMIIMSFNLSDEAFGVIQTPGVMQVYYSLTVLDNCLCWVDSNSKKHINVWIKKGGESWIKSFCLKKSVIPLIIYGAVTPIKFEQNGQLFLWYPYGVVCYNVQDNTTRSFDLNEAQEIFPFVGSFISINSH